MTDPIRELTIGTPLHLSRFKEAPRGWTKVVCESCQGEMYCQICNVPPQPGRVFTLICQECFYKSSESDDV